jgi:hypothetical protein
MQPRDATRTVLCSQAEKLESLVGARTDAKHVGNTDKGAGTSPSTSPKRTDRAYQSAVCAYAICSMAFSAMAFAAVAFGYNCASFRTCADPKCTPPIPFGLSEADLPFTSKMPSVRLGTRLSALDEQDRRYKWKNRWARTHPHNQHTFRRCRVSS